MRRSPSAMKRSCRPNPPPPVRSSFAWVGLTVVTMSAKARPPFQEVDLPVPLELLPVVESPRKADLGHDLGPEVTLVPWIVDRHDDTGAPRGALMREDGAEVHRDQGGVPVVGVEQDGPLHQAGQRHAGGEREEGEAPVIVGVVGPALTVDAVAVEVLEVLDEIHLRAGDRTAGAKDPRLLVSSAEGHHERLADGLEVGLVPHGSVERQDRGDVETRRRAETRRGWRRLRPARRSGRRGDTPRSHGRWRRAPRPPRSSAPPCRAPQPVGGSSPAVSPLIAGA